MRAHFLSTTETSRRPPPNNRPATVARLGLCPTIKRSCSVSVMSLRIRFGLSAGRSPVTGIRGKSKPVNSTNRVAVWTARINPLCSMTRTSLSAFKLKDSTRHFTCSWPFFVNTRSASGVPGTASACRNRKRRMRSAKVKETGEGTNFKRGCGTPPTQLAA